MTSVDLPAFTEALQGVAFVCTGRRAHEDLVAAYFRFLGDLPLSPLVRALDRFAKTVETGRKFPSPREIRAWLSEGSADGLNADQETRIRLHVLEAMEDWEHDGAVGSAWPTFEVAWQSALVAEGWHGDSRPLERHAVWQRWLWHGASSSDTAPLATRAQVKAILTAALPQCSPVFAKALKDIADRIEANREPGEDGEGK